MQCDYINDHILIDAVLKTFRNLKTSYTKFLKDKEYDNNQIEKVLKIEIHSLLLNILIMLYINIYKHKYIIY